MAQASPSKPVRRSLSLLEEGLHRTCFSVRAQVSEQGQTSLKSLRSRRIKDSWALFHNQRVHLHPSLVLSAQIMCSATKKTLPLSSQVDYFLTKVFKRTREKIEINLAINILANHKEAASKNPTKTTK